MKSGSEQVSKNVSNLRFMFNLNSTRSLGLKVSFRGSGIKAITVNCVEYE